MVIRVCVSGLVCALVLLAQPTVEELLERQTVEKLRKYADSLDGVLGMAAIDLNTGRTFSVNGDSAFTQASSIKIPIMIEMFRAARAGKFRLDDKVTLAKEDLVTGSGRIQRDLAQGPVTLTVRELITAMIEFSDNTATNKCISMAGMANVNRLLDELGLRTTRLQRVMMDGPAAARNEENISTPIEMAKLVEMIYRGRFEDSQEMLEIMKLVEADFRRAISEEIPVAAKPGEIDGVRCESGVVFLPNRPFVLSVMAVYLADRRNPVPEVAAIVFEHFDKLARSNRYGHRVR
jgi:beta-lactamase class A